ncbi:Planctomycete cytochrome C [Stieleria maiorica]|uniref:Planctomycete cytochrome C n=1 Tax=Stieleria maiorica TaxID=2795974 RepID=A0A5B9MAM6_9BACT|nr:PSD1 and planctomycete cytochrome C domain-containing protein [Stieleria maiorica]QEF96575.1 Planctomycete cytochrome C [Stieleria maiorica]
MPLGMTVAGERPLSFNRDVRPILSDKCFFCHGPDDTHRAADLRLDQPEAAYEYAIQPGEADQSELIARIVDPDPDVQMPPPETGKRVTEAELAVLRRWIDAGAPYEAYWAYVKPDRVALPEAAFDAPDALPRGAEPDAGSIDRLVRAEVARSPLQPAPRASRRDQLRRLYFDLTGLPPSYDQIADFIADQRPDAYARRVDALLASPRFGERFAQYWLDLVRFADTVGYHGDQVHNIAPYRDYVIDAINDNMPLDRFSREQLAGDLLENPTIEQQIASGYNRLLQTTHEGGLQPKEYLAIYAADRVRNFSAVWMAATMGCAQCHDHKYDPYTAKDFYSLAAFFADVDEEKHFTNGTNALPTRREPEIDVLGRTDRMRLADLDAAIRAAQSESDSDPERMKSLEKERDSVLARKQRTMITKAIEPRTVRFLPRGNWLDDSGDVMQPAVPEFLGDIAAFADLPEGQRATRLDLANWLFDVDHGIGGLTARVFANRLWYLYSGRGISPTLGDFGGQGRPPTNPDLLDHLAGVLIRTGWDLKATVRQIVTSETYRQAVVMDDARRTQDPYNDLAASQSGHRLPAETVRDAVLEMSELLDHQVGGRSVRPYQPEGYYRHLNFPRRIYSNDRGRMLWRRGLYTHWQRQFLHPTLKALDAPSREECTAARSRSNTPLEALALLNDPTFVIAAKAFAARVLRESGTAESSAAAIETRIDTAMRIAIGRDASDLERETLASLLESEIGRFENDPAASEAFLATPSDVSIAWPAEASDAERAAWSSVARAVLNLHETLYRP